MPTLPGFEHLYRLSDPLSNRPLRGEIEGRADWFAITRGEAKPPKLLSVTWSMGGGLPSDFVWTTSVGPVIVNHRVVELLRENKITDWQTYPVIVVDGEGRSHLDYSGLVINGRCGVVDLSRSLIVLSKYPTGWYPHFVGRYFDERSWDGSDFFMEVPDSRGKGTAHLFVTESVRAAFDRAKVKNVRLQNLNDLSTSTLIYECGSKHLLPADFDRRVDAAYRDAGIPRPQKK